MKKITLIGMGCGRMETLSKEAAEVIFDAELLIGAGRLLEQLPQACTQNRKNLYQPQQILEAIQQDSALRIAVLYSGDTGFYSGAQGLIPLLRQQQMDFLVLPGISSVQLLAVALGQSWQNWHLVSAHGTACNAAAECRTGKPTFFLTGGISTPEALCTALEQSGLGELHCVIGENLGMRNAALHRGTAAELAHGTFAKLSVLLVEAVPALSRRSPGLPDGDFVRGQVPMTKQEVRAAVLAKLGVAPSETLWDVGAGTGSVSVELALVAPQGNVFAVEYKPEACELITQNRQKFGAYNLHLIQGLAPDALRELPAPDAVFIGGSKGHLDSIVDTVLQKNPAARICISAIALETLSEGVQSLTRHGLECHVTQIAVSRTRAAGSLNLLMANNPVFLLMGGCDD